MRSKRQWEEGKKEKANHGWWEVALLSEERDSGTQSGRRKRIWRCGGEQVREDKCERRFKKLIEESKRGICR